MSESDFEQIFATHQDAVYGFAWRMTASITIAEDVTQECFLTLFRDYRKFDNRRGTMRSYLFGIARNLVLYRLRTDSRWQALEEETFKAAPLDLVRVEVASMVREAVISLPPLQRETLILVEYEGMQLDEVARTVEAELATVKARLHRARTNLRRMLAHLRNTTCSL